MKTVYFIFSLLTLASCFLEQPTTTTPFDSYPIEDTKTDITDFIKGFLDGVGYTRVYKQIESCITDSETFMVDLATGIRDIQSKNPAKVKEGIRLLGQASKIITQTADECQVANADIQKIIKMIRSFTNPVSFIYLAEKSLLINRVEVFKEVVNVIIAYEEQDYHEVGYWVGKAMNTIFFKSSQGITDARSDILDFVSGFLQGVGITDVSSQIQGCVIDSEEVLADLAVGIQDLQSKNTEKVREGIRVLGQATKIIPEAARACKAADIDIERIIKLIQTFTNPTSFIYHAEKSLLINRVEVIKEVLNAIIAYEKQDYKNLGYWVGEAMATIFLKSQVRVQDASTEVLDFVEGFLGGIGSAAAFNQIRECIDDSETVLVDLTTGVEDIKSKDPAKVKEGIQLIGKAVQIIPDAVQLCKAGEVDLEELIKMVETFKSPVSFLYYVGKSLVINHVEVFNEVSNAVTAYDDKNYNQLGYWVGKAMDTILLGQDVLTMAGLMGDNQGSEVPVLRKIVGL